VRKRTGGYALSFLLVLLAGLIGALVGLRAIQRTDLGRATWPDSEEGLQLISTVLAQAAPATPGAGLPTLAPTPSPAPTKGPSLLIPTPVPPTPTPVPTLTPVQRASPTRAPRPTPTPPTPTPIPPTPTPESHYEFIPAGPVRHTTEGCAGQAIRGTVYDQAGNPLPGIRLWMYDQWANEAFAESKSGAIDLGQYDFPIFHNSPVTFYVTVLGPDGSRISPTVEVPHRQGPYQAANCHWLDWKRTR